MDVYKNNKQSIIREQFGNADAQCALHIINRKRKRKALVHIIPSINELLFANFIQYMLSITNTGNTYRCRL